MSIIDAINSLKTTLNTASITVELDSTVNKYTFPCVIIELDTQTPDENSSDGRIISSTYKISLLCMVSAQGKTWSTYKAEAIAFKDSVLSALINSTDVRVKPLSLGYAETLVGSQKVSMTDIVAEIQFNET